MITMPKLLLTCRLCGWRPEPEQTLLDVARHFEVWHHEHPSDMRLSAYCPSDDRLLVHRFDGRQPSSGRTVSTYDCQKCTRTYRVVWRNERRTLADR